MRVKSPSPVESVARARRVSVGYAAAMLTAAAGFALAGCATHPAIEPAAPQSRGSAAAVTEGATPSAPADAAARMVAAATAMLGQPYRFGGAAPGGFDCSGLVSFAAQSAGVSLPRTAREQLGSGVRIGRRELEPGDLVFMRLARKELHVGIVTDGERFIHAPATGGRVRIDSLDAAPYSAGFIGARRVIGTGGRASGL
jgi:cell wall-associated NlpC family hydrolase